MDQDSHWIPPSLVLLAVFALAATVADGMFLDGILMVFAVGLLVASYGLRHRARTRLVYQCDPHDDEYRLDPVPRPRRPRP